MKKIIYLVVVLLAGLSACEKLNEYPEFDDGDAFVAFDNSSLSVDESGVSLNIPVTLASVSGMTGTVNYRIVDGTAKLGENFTLADPSGSLTFNAENRTQDIVINIINNDGVFTGDLNFTIELSEDGAIKPSNENSCKITIVDLDHPLAAILGTWKADGVSYFSGPASWEMEFTKDAEDISVVWISNFVTGGSNLPVYGIVNAEQTEILIPSHQEILESSSYPLVRLEGWYGPSGDESIEEGSNFTLTISGDKSEITILDWFGSNVYSDEGGTNSLGWYNIIEANTVLTRP